MKVPALSTHRLPGCDVGASGPRLIKVAYALRLYLTDSGARETSLARVKCNSGSRACEVGDGGHRVKEGVGCDGGRMRDGFEVEGRLGGVAGVAIALAEVKISFFLGFPAPFGSFGAWRLEAFGGNRFRPTATATRVCRFSLSKLSTSNRHAA